MAIVKKMSMYRLIKAFHGEVQQAVTEEGGVFAHLEAMTNGAASPVTEEIVRRYVKHHRLTEREAVRSLERAALMNAYTKLQAQCDSLTASRDWLRGAYVDLAGSYRDLQNATARKVGR